MHAERGYAMKTVFARIVVGNEAIVEQGGVDNVHAGLKADSTLLKMELVVMNAGKSIAGP